MIYTAGSLWPCHQAAKEAVWDEAAKSLKLHLSHKDGPVEVIMKWARAPHGYLRQGDEP